MKARYSEVTVYHIDANHLEDLLNTHLGLEKYVPEWEKHGNKYWHSTLVISSWHMEKDTSREVYPLKGEPEFFIANELAEYVNSGGRKDEHLELNYVIQYLIHEGVLPYGDWLVSRD